MSTFSELEILSSLPSLRNLWLEGNPFCCARWYRPQVFSFFPYPDKLKLDDKEISTREFWKRQIIIARRQTRPASYGFYSPAIEDTEEEGLLSRKTKKVSRVASIESEEPKRYSDQDSASSSNEIHSEDEKAATVDEPEIAGLINRIEIIKKERSIHQLWDLDNWMDRPSKNVVNGSKYGCQIPSFHGGNCGKPNPRQKYVGESLKYESDSIHASDYSVSNILESENSFVGLASRHHDHPFPVSAKETASKPNHGQSEQRTNAHLMQDYQDYLHMKKYHPYTEHSSHTDLGAKQGDNNLNTVVNVRRMNVINDILETRVTSAYPRSPPHFEEDILQRLHDLKEEFLQLSAESFSVVSSDSDTSSNEDETFGHAPQFHNKQTLQQVLLGEDSDGDSSCHSLEMSEHQNVQLPKAVKIGRCSSDLPSEQVCDRVHLGPECSLEMHHAGDINEKISYAKQEAEKSETMRHKRKAKKRVVPLGENDVCKNGVSGETKPFDREAVNTGLSKDGCGDEIEDHTVYRSEIINNEHVDMRRNTFPLDDQAGVVHSPGKHPVFQMEKQVEHYFNSVIADSGVHETCREFILCSCIVEQEMQHEEREVIVVLSSEGKLYSIPVNAIFYGSGNDAGLISSYKVEDVSEILVGLGLQLVRVYVAGYAAFVYIMKNAEKSRDFLHMFENFNSDRTSHHICLRSLECVQIELFDKKICGHSNVGIYQYSMVLFTCDGTEDGHWISRSLFVSPRHLFVCIEDVEQFGSLSTDAASSDYFLLDSICCIADVSELVIEGKGSHCVTLKMESSQSESCVSGITKLMKFNTGLGREKGSSQSKTWRFKWLSEATFSKFVTLLKAIHAGMAMSTLSIKCIS